VLKCTTALAVHHVEFCFFASTLILVVLLTPTFQQHRFNSMKIFKKVVISLAMAMSMAAISSTAFSAESKDLNAVVRMAAEGTIAKIEEALSLVEKGGDTEAAIAAINEARQLQKEFRYELTERSRQKANDKLRVAREALQSGDTKTAEETLKATLATFKEMKVTYDASHK
jgi:uncharacterized membrane protein